MSLQQRLHRRWDQFRIETQWRLASFQGLVVNLHYYGKYRQAQTPPVVVLLDSWREAGLLALLRLLGVLPAHRVHVIRRSGDVQAHLGEGAGQALLFVTTSFYTKYYQPVLRLETSHAVLIV